jgi:lipopolysaccharide transport system permease protein
VQREITGLGLFKFSDLLFAWTWRIIRARYKQSVLGGAWAILQPAATVAIFTVIFTQFMRIDTGGIPYVVFSFTAMVPWTLFTTSVSDMVESLVSNINLVTKIYFPREILPVAALLARMLDFVIAFGILMILMVFYGLPLFTQYWVYLPAILVTQLALALGLGLFGAATNVFYRDIKHLFTLGLQIWLYASPIIYPVTLVPERLKPYYYLNPMAGVLEAYRDVLLHQQAPGSYLLTSMVVAFAILCGGYLFFKHVEPQFADIV